MGLVSGFNLFQYVEKSHHPLRLFLFHPGVLWQIHAFWGTRWDHQSELLHGVGSAVGCGSEASVSFLHTSSPPFSCRGQGNV